MTTIRAYDPARDLAACLRVWRAASEVGHPFLPAEALDADAALVRDVYMPKAEVWVAEAEGEVAGFVALLDAVVGGLFVAPDRHGGGIGRALIDHAAARRGALEVEVYEANAGARAFYRRVGFVETGRRETDDQSRPLPLIAMRRATSCFSTRRASRGSRRRASSSAASGQATSRPSPP